MKHRSRSVREHRQKDLAAEKAEGDPGGSQVHFLEEDSAPQMQN